MVGIAVEVHAGRECAARIALTVAFGVFKELAVEHFGAEEMPTVVGGVDEVAGEDNLVEEVPRRFVGEGADAFVEHRPPGVEEAVSVHAVFFLFGSEHLGARFIHRVVVEVAH